MGLFDHFPYTNFHELNLDWILKMLREIDTTMEQFVAINALKYADPIQWDITSQYEKNTIVIDPQTGTAYISVAPVPSGVSLSNPDYWSVVFDLSAFIIRAAKNFTNRYEAEDTVTATFNSSTNDWLVWGDTLYKANTNITAGDTYVDGGNISHFTIEELIGHIEDLNTTDTSNIVNAINEVNSKVTQEITDRSDADNTINTRITNIDPYEKFRNKTICVIGDSISDFGVLADNWVKRLTDFMANYNCTVINEAQNGRSFASLKVELDNSTFTMPVADYYVLFIGTNYNDTWGYTGGTYPLLPAINAVHNAIIGANSHAKYFFLSPLKKWIHLNQELNDISFMRAYLEKEFAYRGYTVLSGYNIGELSTSTKSYYMLDDIHPNANFSDILFRYVLDGMVSERSNVIVGCKKARSIVNTLGSNSSITFEYDSELKVSVSITVFGWSPTLNQWIDLCDMPTLLEANTTPLVQVSSQNAVVPQYRVQNGKLQIYFFSAPSPSVFYDYLVYSMSFATSD